MKRSWVWIAALVALSLPAGSALGAPAAQQLSTLALSVTDPGEAGAVDAAPAATLAPERAAALGFGGAEFAKAPPPTYESVRYRPRRRYREPDRYRDEETDRRRSEAFSQIHAGFVDPDGEQNASFLLGFRGAIVVDDHIQIGGQLDWAHKSTSEGASGPPIIGPGGVPITPQDEVSRSSLNLFPLMGFVQISADRSLPVVPYFGAGAGYELLFLRQENFQTGDEFSGTFDGFGWQVWGGAGIPLSTRARFNAEVFVNNAELTGDVENTGTGESFRGIVDMDGVGMRFGLAWGY
jgi:hypothetical protein